MRPLRFRTTDFSLATVTGRARARSRSAACCTRCRRGWSARLKVHIYDDRLSCWLGTTQVLELPRRHRPRRGDKRVHVVDYRHLAGALIRKPQAFRRSVFRDELFPRPVFRRLGGPGRPVGAACRLPGLCRPVASGGDARLRGGAGRSPGERAGARRASGGRGRPAGGGAAADDRPLSSCRHPIRPSTTACSPGCRPEKRDDRRRCRAPAVDAGDPAPADHRPALAELRPRADAEGWERPLSRRALRARTGRARPAPHRPAPAGVRPAGRQDLRHFDFAAVPTVRKAHLLALAQADSWIEQGANILCFGPSGTGKSHAAAAIGYALIEQGRRVLFTRHHRHGATAAGGAAGSVAARADRQARPARLPGARRSRLRPQGSGRNRRCSN